MEISNKSQFNALAKCLHYGLLASLSNAQQSIKDSRCKELLATMQGFNTANGLLASLPIELDTSSTAITRLVKCLKSKHQYKLYNPDNLVQCMLEHFERSSVNENQFVSPFFTDLTYLSGSEITPLVSEPDGSLKRSLSFLYYLVGSRIIYPDVVTQLTKLDMPSVKSGMVRRYPISDKASLLELKQVLTSSELSSYLLAIEAGFSETSADNGLRFGHLNDSAKIAEAELQTYLINKLGKPTPPEVIL